MVIHVIAWRFKIITLYNTQTVLYFFLYELYFHPFVHIIVVNIGINNNNSNIQVPIRCLKKHTPRVQIVHRISQLKSSWINILRTDKYIYIYVYIIWMRLNPTIATLQRWDLRCRHRNHSLNNDRLQSDCVYSVHREQNE